MRRLLVYLGLGLIILSGVSRATIVPPGVPPSKASLSEDLTQARAADSVAVGRFSSLIEAAEYYAALHDQGWFPISAGPVLYPGQWHQQIGQLRYLLSLYGDYQRPVSGRIQLNRLDGGLAEALRRFQRRHGLSPDGVLGPETRHALNIPPRSRAYQLLLNHERQLALRKRLPKHYVQVNLPEFRLRLYQDDRPVLDMRTIIGSQSRSTPTLDSEITSLVVNPAWNIPRSIAYQDIFPKWQADAGYLARHNMRIVSGWGAEKVWIDKAEPQQLYRGSAYPRLYQLPGPHNALGQIKFNSPNASAIYLHDTPVKSLFDKDQRAFSSGCIRVENPRLLARYLLGSQVMKEPLDDLWARTDTREIRLQNPVGLYLTYWTAWLDSQYGLQFRKDIYHRDQPRLEEQELGGLITKERESSGGS